MTHRDKRTKSGFFWNKLETVASMNGNGQTSIMKLTHVTYTANLSVPLEFRAKISRWVPYILVRYM